MGNTKVSYLLNVSIVVEYDIMLRSVLLKKIMDSTRKRVFAPKKIVVPKMKVMEKKGKLRKFSS